MWRGQRKEAPMRRSIFAGVRRFLRHRRGATAIEYALIAGGIAAVLVGAIATLGGKVEALWTAVKAAFN
jgi:pilus assembly protein Flp/PilA